MASVATMTAVTTTVAIVSLPMALLLWCVSPVGSGPDQPEQCPAVPLDEIPCLPGEVLGLDQPGQTVELGGHLDAVLEGHVGQPVEATDGAEETGEQYD